MDMDMKELFANGCFVPDWTEVTEDAKTVIPDNVVPARKELNTLLDELAEIKENIENLQAKSWYLNQLRQYKENGFSRT
jgi:hypothetical protein